MQLYTARYEGKNGNTIEFAAMDDADAHAFLREYRPGQTFWSMRMVDQAGA